MRGVPVIAAIVAFAIAPLAAGQDAPQPEARPSVVKLTVERPPRVVHRKAHFTPPARPTPAYVLGVIVPYEAARHGANAYTLHRRIMCESHGHWWAQNGQFSGVLQFAPGTFWRGMTTIGSKSVELVTVRHRSMHSRVYRHWSTGRITRSRGRAVRQTVITRRRGSIGGSVTWLQVRIGAQANAGRSAVHDSEWSCR